MARNFVIANDGQIMVQINDAKTRWGFYLAREAIMGRWSWSGATSWDVIPSDDPRITPEDHERLDWLLTNE